MHVRFVGEPDDGLSVSSHHAQALARAGVAVSFDAAPVDGGPESSRPDAIHLVTFEQRNSVLLRRLVAARMGGTAVVRFWTQRGILWARHHGPTRDFAKATAQLGAIQLCRSVAAAGELAALGIVADPIPIVSTNLSNVAEPQPLPALFTVLCYLPGDRRAYHGEDLVAALARQFAPIRFLILGDGSDRLTGLRNVEPLGIVENSARTIQRATAVVDARMDGTLSRLMLEALCHGRHVISSHPVPHGFLAHTIEEASEALRSIRGEQAFNLAGREYVCREYDQHHAVRILRRTLESAVEPGRLNLAFGGGVRGAAAVLRNLHLVGQRRFDLPDPTTLPPEAGALRALLAESATDPVALPA